jgi:dihydrolipoamide dehydrogenase
MSTKYDLVIIGSGPAGYTAAIAAAQNGMKAVIIENSELGGTCLNRGCIPTKTLLHSAGLYQEMKYSESLGIMAEKLSYDLPAMYGRKDQVVLGLRQGIEALLKANQIEYLFGKAKVLSSKQVMVKSESEEQMLSTDKVLIATGSVPVWPGIEGMDLEGVITSDELLQGQVLDYKKLIIIGGGVIGVEIASIYSNLDCDVTIIEALDRIVPTMDREISQNLSMILKKRNVVIQTASVLKAIKNQDGKLVCSFTGKKGEQELEASTILAAVGRKPNIEDLFDEKLQIQIKKGIVVNESFETSVKGIYAIGDVIDGSIQLAHAAFAQAQNVVASMLGKEPIVNLTTVPSCIYTSPEIASVGITADEAKDKGISVKTGKYTMSQNAKTVIEKQERSFIKLVFDAETETILGAQLMCARASDLVSELSTAIANQLTVHQLASVIRPHPTFTEAITEAVENCEGRAIHIMPKRKL